MAGRDGRLDLVGTGPAGLSGLHEQGTRAGDGGVVPAGAILVAQEHQAAGVVEAGGGAGLVQAQQRQQAQDRSGRATAPPDAR